MSKIAKTARIALIATVLLHLAGSGLQAQTYWYNLTWAVGGSDATSNTGWFSTWHHYNTSDGAFIDGNNWSPTGSYSAPSNNFNFVPRFDGAGSTVWLGASPSRRGHSGHSTSFDYSVPYGDYVAQVGDMFITNGTYVYIGDYGTSVHDLNAAPQIAAKSGQDFGGGQLSTGKLYMRTEGIVRFNIATQFRGGIQFDSGRFEIGHDAALGVYRINEYSGTYSEGTWLGTYWWEGSNPTNKYTEGAAAPEDSNFVKFDSNGVIYVMGNNADEMIVSNYQQPSDSFYIQNRFIVSPGKTLRFDTPYGGTSGNDPVLVLNNVDTTGYKTVDNNNQLFDVLGGTIYLQDGANLNHTKGGTQNLGALQFVGNRAVRGGAIYATNVLTIHGNTLFEGNYAVDTNDNTKNLAVNLDSARGGAIYMAGGSVNNRATLTLNVASDGGDILFRRNAHAQKDIVASTLSNPVFTPDRAESVFLENYVNMEITGNRFVYFEDAINTDVESVGNTLTVNLSSNSLDVDAFIQFAPDIYHGFATTDSVLSHKEKDGGRVTIESGEFRIVDGATFSTDGYDSFFTVEKNTTTEARLAGSGIIEAGKGFLIQGTIAPDNHKYLAPSYLSVLQKPVAMPDSAKIGTLTLRGDVMFDGATIKIDTAVPTVADPLPISGSDRIDIVRTKNNTDADNDASGKLYFTPVAGRSTIEIDTWRGTGKFVIATVQNKNMFFDANSNQIVTNDTIMQYFNNVAIAGGRTMTGRQGTSIKIEENLLGNGEGDLVLYTSNDARLYLVWTGRDTANWNKSNNTIINWGSTRSRDYSDFDTDTKVASLERMYFMDGDYVFFTGQNYSGDIISVTTDNVVVAGMEVLAGNYEFNSSRGAAGIINSTTGDHIGVVPTGKLRVASEIGTAPTVVSFLKSTYFENGTELSGDATIVYGDNASLGAFNATATGKLQGVVKLTSYVDNDGNTDGDGNGTIDFGGDYGFLCDRVANHFWVTEGNTLTLNTRFETVTITGVHTSLFDNPDGTLPGINHLNGGAFHFEKATEFKRVGTGRLEIVGNTAREGGGIYAQSSLFVGGNTVFDNSATTGNGNDIFVLGDADQNLTSRRALLTLDTDDGDILFRGTNALAGSSAIFMETGTDLVFSGTGNVIINGSIDTASGRNMMTVSNEGFVQLMGDSVLNIAGSTNGQVTVNAGATLRLVDDATFTTGGYPAVARFDLLADGRLEGTGTFINTTGNTGFLLNGTLSPDSDILSRDFDDPYNDHLVVGENDSSLLIGRLIFNGSTILSDATFEVDLKDTTVLDPNSSDQIVVNGTLRAEGLNTIDVQTVGSSSVGYDIIVSDRTIQGSLDNFELLVMGAAYEESPREQAALSFKDGNSTNSILHLSFTYNNLNLIWNGTSSNNAWNTSAGNTNWKTSNAADGPQRFANYDAVTFDASTQQRNVVVDNAVKVSRMTIEGGDYTFSGTGRIDGVADSASGSVVQNQDGALLITGGSGTFNLETRFVGGITLQNGGIGIGHDQALGAYDETGTTPNVGLVEVTGTTGTLFMASTATPHTIQNRFLVGTSGTTLAVNIGIGQTLTISGVETASNGGAFFVASGSTMEKTGNGALILDGNEAARGGAVYAEENLYIGGNTLFRNNRATSGLGNAIYMAGTQAGTLTLDATDGNGSAADIAFVEGSVGTTDSIHLAKDTKLSIIGSGSVYIDVPVSSAGTDNSFEVAMETGGMVQFRGASTINGTTGDLLSGTMRLAGTGASFTLNDGASVFNVASQGILAGNGTLTAGTIDVRGILSPDSYVYQAPSNLDGTGGRTPLAGGTNIGRLDLTGNTTIYGGTVFNIDLADGLRADRVEVTGTLQFQDGKTKLNITTIADGEGFVIFHSNNAIRLINDDKDQTFEFAFADGSSGSSRVVVEIETPDANTVVLNVKKDAAGNAKIYWTGLASAGQDLNWYSTGSTDNWVETDGSRVAFLEGDYVVFDDTAERSRRTVTVDGGDVITAGMEINGVDYVFNALNGQTIVGTTDARTTYAGKTGRLDIGGGATVAMNVGTKFEKGTTLDDATVQLGHNQALGSYIDAGADEGKVVVTGTATVEAIGTAASATSNEIQNRFDVQSDASLNLATRQGTSLTIDSVDDAVVLEGDAALNITTADTITFNAGISAAGDNNTFNFSGGGTLAFNGVEAVINSASHVGGAVQIDAGILALQNGAHFQVGGTGSTFALASGARLVGSGSITAETSTLKGTLDIGDNGQSATFTFNGDLVLDGATLKLGVNGLSDYDSIRVVGGGLDFGTSLNTIDLTAGILAEGRYDIIVTDTGVAANYQDRFGPVLVNSERSSATLELDSTGNILQLVTSFSDSSGLTWTGEVNGNWNTNSLNWVDDDNNPIAFQMHDYVTFAAGAKNQTIEITGDWEVCGMKITGGAYVFNGASITGTSTVSGNGVTATERLDITGGTVVINNQMNFAKGTRIGGGAAVTLGNDKALGTYVDSTSERGQVAVTGQGSIKVEADRTIKNRFVVNADAAFNLSVKSGATLVIGTKAAGGTGANAYGLDGGAFNLASGATLRINGGGNVVIGGNRARNGAGVYAADNLDIGGNVLFVNNIASGIGGAIYMAGNSAASALNFDTTAGDIGFFGNFGDSGATGSAVYLEKNTKMSIFGTHTVYFGDAVASGSAGGNSLLVKDTATAVFGENSVINAGTTGGAIDVEGGTVKVLGGVTLESVGSGSLLTVAKAGTLAGGGTIATEGGVLVKGTLSADSDKYDFDPSTGKATLDAASIGKLTIASDVQLDGATLAVDLGRNNTSDNIHVEGEVDFGSTANKNSIDIGVWFSGTFDLLTADGGFVGDKSYWNDIAVSERQQAELNIVKKNGNDVLQLVTTSLNDSLLWTNGPDASGNMLWNSLDKNWDNSRAQADIYVDGDMVSFTGYGQGEITIDKAGVVTGGMRITRGDYSFLGGSLGGSKTGSNYSGATGMLEITGGSALFDSAVSFDSGILISGTSLVEIAENGTMNSQNGDFRLASTATLIVTPKTGMIEANEVVLDGTVLVDPPANLVQKIDDVIVARNVALDEERLSSIFNRTYGLHGQSAEFSDAGKRMALDYREIGMREYANINRLQWNMREMSYLLDDVFANKEFKELYDYLLQQDSNVGVDMVLDQMRGTEIAANSLAMSLWNPWRPVFTHLNQDQRLVTPTAYQSFYRGQLGSQGPSTRDFWIQAFHRTTEASQDGNSRSYVLSRTGIVLGIDKKLDIDTTLGAVLSYASPEYSSVYGKNEADDWGMAVYVKRYFGEDVYVNAYLGFGHQEYRYKRHQYLGGNFETLRAKYDGNSLYGSIEAVRPIMWKRGITFMLVSALDLQKTWAGDFTESGSAFAQSVSDGEMGQLNMRLGLNSRWRIVEDFSVDTRLQYSRLLTGDDCGEVATTFAGLATPVTSRRIRGIDLGEEWLNVGIGCQAYMTPRRTMYFFVDYDFDVGYKSTSHQGQIGFVRQF